MMPYNGCPQSTPNSRRCGGIVGLGSLGSKVAISLAHSGLRRFLLVDDDVLLPENICRHESSWASVGLHKVQALEEELSLIAASMEVEVYMHRVGGQESAMRAARVLKELGSCDLLIDATADPAVFLRLAAVARANLMPLCWGEVFASGFGGLIARATTKLRARPPQIHEGLPTRTETDFGSHPCCVVSVIASGHLAFTGQTIVNIVP